MIVITGKYKHERNDNIDAYFKALGVPYLVRKIIAVSHPELEISQNDEKWSIKNVTLTNTQAVTFRLNEEYEEVMPSGDVLQNVTTLEGDSLVTVSRMKNGIKTVRKYDITDDRLILTMTLEGSDQIATRYYKRIL